MVLFDFNQESVDTTFVDESLIDDASCSGSTDAFTACGGGKRLNKMNSTHRCIRSLSISTAHQAPVNIPDEPMVATNKTVETTTPTLQSDNVP